ncbi:hypothetical protein BCR44DRAFT_1440602 [Catenaria anguillulae PL171]|uniref:Uncharacterized protein n=1 Tax=Catenaria anguillulae PL171 TaxID=765915 RepID=A0A1Y2HCV3_9FUNG|nr:hypothetical protein BCR44DRAFT_1440602 [Catenaria anguillulae PL171]
MAALSTCCGAPNMPGTPGSPYGLKANELSQVQASMRRRREAAAVLLDDNEFLAPSHAFLASAMPNWPRSFTRTLTFPIPPSAKRTLPPRNRSLFPMTPSTHTHGSARSRPTFGSGAVKRWP